MRALYTKQKIQIKNPYVIMVSHCPAKEFNDDTSAKFRQMKKSTRDIAADTWGYSELWTLSGVPAESHLYPLYAKEGDVVISYWFFKEESDALAFRLKAFGECRQVIMWPEKIVFTVYEYTET